MMWPAFCCFMCGSAAAMPYCTPLMLTSIVRSHSSILRRSRCDCGISPALLIMTSIRPCVCTAVSTNLFHMIVVDSVCSYGERLAATSGQLVHQRLEAIERAVHLRQRLRPGRREAGRLPRTRPLLAPVIRHVFLDCFSRFGAGARQPGPGFGSRAGPAWARCSLSACWSCPLTTTFFFDVIIIFTPACHVERRHV